MGGTEVSGEEGSNVERKVAEAFEKANPDGCLTLQVFHDGMELRAQREIIKVDTNWKNYGYIFKVQVPLGKVKIFMSSGEKDTDTWKRQDIEIEEFNLLFRFLLLGKLLLRQAKKDCQPVLQLFFQL